MHARSSKPSAVPPTPPTRIAAIALAALLGLASAQFAWNAARVPALSGYDAGPHAGYVLSIIENAALPDPYSGTVTFHPPLYYLVGSAVWTLLEPAGARAINLGLRAIGGLAVLAAAVLAFGLVRTRSDWKVAWVSTGLLLFVPVVQISASMIGNEALAAGLSGLALPALLKLQRDPRNTRQAALAAFFAALALATKYTGGFVAIACILPFLRRDFDRQMLRSLLVAAAVGAFIAGPVYVRNLQLTGHFAPFTRDLEPLKSMEAGNILRPRQVKDYLWIDPSCLLRPSIHYRANAPAAELSGARLQRNPAMTNVWGLTYASLWYDAQGHRIPLRFHHDGILSGPLLTFLGVVPTIVMLIGFAVALQEFVRRRGRSDDGPLVVVWIVGIASFTAFTWWAQSVVAVKASYLLALAVPGAVFFARGVTALGPRLRPWILGAGCAAAFAAAVVFTADAVFPSPPADRMAQRYRLMGSFLPDSYISEASDRLAPER